MNTENPPVLLKAYVPLQSTHAMKRATGLHKAAFSFSKTDVVN